VLTIKEIKLLADYPSGSALTFLNDSLYLVGDDAPWLLVMDAHLNVIHRSVLVETAEKRIPKNLKQDLEAMAVISLRQTKSLLLMGSGSTGQRMFCNLLTPGSKEMNVYDLRSFCRRIQDAGIKDVNIEGVAAIPGGLVLASRGNKSFPRNYLVFTDQFFFKDPDSVDFKLVQAGSNTDTAFFNGISGLEYAAGSDKLLVTVSTENTYNSYTDGSIGKSFLWIINDITTRKRFTHVNPDRIIDLEKEDARFKGHKIESVCILSENRKEMELVLAADDDNGQTLLFKVQVRKN
jgi:hypothetical protein